MGEIKSKFNKINLDQFFEKNKKEMTIKKSYTKSKLNEKDFIWENDKEYVPYIPKHVRDEIEKKDALIKELKEELEEIKKEIEMIKFINEDC